MKLKFLILIIFTVFIFIGCSSGGGTSSSGGGTSSSGGDISTNISNSTSILLPNSEIAFGNTPAVVNNAVAPNGNSSACSYSTISITSTSVDATIQSELSETALCHEVKLTAGTADITLDGNTENMILNKIYTVNVN